MRPRGVPKTGVGLSEDVKETICSLHASGRTGRQISDELVIGYDTIYRCLDQSDVQIRDQSQCMQKHALNCQYFDNIDSPEKAYWLGFIAADGNVYRNMFQIDLKASDHGHLVKLRDALGSSHPVTTRTSVKNGVEHEQARLAISNVRLVAALARLGITERKSQTCAPWSGPSELLSHYWRGVIDGDGSIGPSGVAFQVAINGSRSMCQAFLTWVNDTAVRTNASVTKGHGAVFSARIHGISMIKDILRVLDYQSSPVLERKAASAATILAERQVLPTRKRRNLV